MYNAKQLEMIKIIGKILNQNTLNGVDRIEEVYFQIINARDYFNTLIFDECTLFPMINT
jgi:hypothetical protein